MGEVSSLQVPLPPSVGEGGDGGAEALAPPPPEPSPVKGEGQYTSPSEPPGGRTWERMFHVPSQSLP
jgi:hypothetical protein